MMTTPVSTASLASCLGASGAPSCFGATRVHASASTTSSITSAPVLANNQPFVNSGPTVTLTWTAPGTGVPTSYIVEASNAPGGPANLANFNTGNALTTLVAPGVPAGTYYVRIRAVDAGGAGPPSNEVQLIVAAASGAVCPSAPLGLSIVSQSGGNLTLGWQPPSIGTPTSYVIQAGSFPGVADLANFDTGSAALSLSASGVGAGAYYVRVYAKSSSCAAPAFTGPSSNEILLIVGGSGAATPGWSGQIVCRIQITGPSSYNHDETQTWTISGPGQVISSARVNYPVQWTSRGSGGAVGKSWSIDLSRTTDLSATVIASTGLTGFDRTTTPIVIPGGMVGTPTSFTDFEIDFPPFSTSSVNATSVVGTYSRASAAGDSPQQPGGSSGTVSCSWSLVYR